MAIPTRTKLLGAAARHHRRRLACLEHCKDETALLGAAIRAARDAGFSLAEIGEAIGLSRQRVHELSG